MKIKQDQMFKRDIFEVIFDYTHEDRLEPQEIINNLKIIIDFMRHGNDDATLRAFLITKMKREGSL